MRRCQVIVLTGLLAGSASFLPGTETACAQTAAHAAARYVVGVSGMT